MVTWEQIMALPEYQQASPEKKERAKQAYLALMKSKAEKGNRDVLGGSVVTSGVEKANEQRKQEAEVQRRARAQMGNMKARGVRVPEEEPLRTPVYDPVDLAVDAATGFMGSAGKAAVKAGAKALAKNVAREVGTGAVAGGAMALADKAGAGAVGQLAAGLGGGVAGGAVLTGTRRLIASLVKRGIPESQAARIVGEMTPEAVEKAVKAIEPTPGRIGKQTPVKRIGVAQAADAAKVADDVTLHPEAEDYADMMADYTPTQGRQAIPPVEAQGAKAQAVTEKYRYAKAPKEGPYGVEDTVKPVDKVEVVAKPEPETDPYLGQTEGFVPEEAIDVGKRVPIPEGVRHLPEGVTRGEDGKLYITIPPAKRTVKVAPEVPPQVAPEVPPQVAPQVAQAVPEALPKVEAPTGKPELVGYEWRNTNGERFRAWNGEAVPAKVSDWDKHEVSAGSGKDIVHVYWIKDVDGTVQPYGKQTALKKLGMGEGKLQGALDNITRKESETKSTLKNWEEWATSDPNEARNLFASRNKDSNVRMSEGFFYEKDGKYIITIPSEFKDEVASNAGYRKVGPANKLPPSPGIGPSVPKALPKVEAEYPTVHRHTKGEIEQLIEEETDKLVAEIPRLPRHRAKEIAGARLVTRYADEYDGLRKAIRAGDHRPEILALDEEATFYPHNINEQVVDLTGTRTLLLDKDVTDVDLAEQFKHGDAIPDVKPSTYYMKRHFPEPFHSYVTPKDSDGMPVKVDATLYNDIAVHKSLNGKGYTVRVGENVLADGVGRKKATEVAKEFWEKRLAQAEYPDLAPKVEAPSGVGPSVPKAAMSDPGNLGIVSDEYLGKVPQPIRRFFGGLLEYRYGQPEEYKQIAEGALNTTAYVSTQARKMVDSAKGLAQKLKVADSDVLNYLQGYTANVPKELAAELDTIRATIDKWGDEAVKATLLSPEKRKAGYLARLYERHLIDAYEPTLEARQGAIDWLIQSKNAANEEEAESLIQSILEGNGVKLVNGPAIPAKLDMGRFMERQDVPYPIRQLLGEVSNPYYLAYRSIKDVARDVTQVKLFKQIAENPLWASKTAKPGFVKINKSALPKGLSHALDTMRDKWGDIGDLYIKKEIAEDLKHTYAEAPEYARMYGVLQSTWKMMKVPMNPATVTTNIISNSILAHLGGVPLWKQAVALPDAMLNVIRSRKGQMDPLYEALEKAHLFTGNYTENELGLLYEGLGLAMNRTKNNGLRLAYALQWAVKKAGGQKAADFYGAVEDTYKYMLAKHYMVSGRGATVQDMLRGNGKKVKLTPEQAVKEAELWLFNYRQLPEPLKAMRRTVIPFISWPYFSGKAMARAVVNYPHRVLPVLALGYAIDDKMKDEGKDIKLSKYLPYMDTMNEDWGTLGGIPIPPNLNPGGVGVSLYEGFLGRSAHGGRDIFASDDPDSVKAQKQREYFWNTYTPPMLGYSGKRVLDAVTGQPKNRYGDVEDVGTALAGSLAGVQIRPDDRVTHYREYKRLMGKIEQEKNYLKWYLKQGYSEADKRERIELARQRIAEFARQRDESLQALRMARQ